MVSLPSYPSLAGEFVQNTEQTKGAVVLLNHRSTLFVILEIASLLSRVIVPSVVSFKEIFNFFFFFAGRRFGLLIKRTKLYMLMNCATLNFLLKEALDASIFDEKVVL